MGNTLPPLDSSTQHIDDKGKPTKDFFNWIKSLGDFVNKNVWPSLVVGSPTGGNKGAGSINAETIYFDGTELGTAATKDVGVAAGNVVQLDGSAKLPAVDGSQLTGISSTGRLIAGTSLVQNPFAQNVSLSQAHGLGQLPIKIIPYLECLTAELGYSVGDRIFGPQLTFSATSQWSADSTNIYLVTSNNPAQIMNRSTKAAASITAANWKQVLTPYKLS